MEGEDNLKENKFPKSELREYEQYFFSENMLKQITDSLQYEEKILCLCTPAVADAFWRLHQKEVLCLDIDERFSYLPQFKKCDITKINELPLDKDYVPNVIIVDPPFFKMNLLDLYKCINAITKGNFNTKIVFAFVIREAKAMLSIFKDYKLRLTKFNVEYENVDKGKWSNYGLYSNFESGKIKFIKNK